MSKANSNRQRQADTKPSKIPKFDLADEIMAEQRKISAVRRKGPGKIEAPRQEREAQSIGYAIMPPPMISEAEQIIAEIVTRDIQDLKSEI